MLNPECVMLNLIQHLLDPEINSVTDKSLLTLHLTGWFKLYLEKEVNGMKKSLVILTLIVALGMSSLGLAGDCPLEGTPQCPKVPPCCQQ